MKKYFLLFLLVTGFSVSVQAQVLIDEFIIGASAVVEDTADQVTNNNKVHEDSSLRNSLEHEVDVFLSKKFLLFWRTRQGAFKENGNNTSALPNGLIKEMDDFELGDNLILQFPTKAFYRDSVFTGVKIIFDHRISANQVGMYMNNNETVEIVFEITSIESADGIINHIWGHICSPLDEECK